MKTATEKRLIASGYNLDKGPASKTYVKIWNEAIDRAIEKLSDSPGGATRYTIEKLEELKK